MKRVFLQNNKGFCWYSSENCFVKGYFFDSVGNYYYGENLLSYFEGIDSFSDFEERVKYANGVFAVIFKLGNELFAGTDKIRSFPLFFLRNKGQWMISDNPYFLLEANHLTELNYPALTEFKSTGYVTGSDTLIEGIRQVQAGEIIHFKEDDLHNKFYFSFRVSKVLEESYELLKEAGRQVFERAFSRFISSIENKNIFVPLSGGYDSRLIAVMLKLSGFKNVTCFSYGRKGNPEAVRSRQVAEKLGFPWLFIEYNDELIGNFIEDQGFLDYFPMGSNLSSMFYLQEYFAVKYLKENGIADEKSVFVPGHSGDFLGGSQLNKHGNISLEEGLDVISERIFRVKYCYFAYSKKESIAMTERIRKSLQEKFRRDADYAYSIHEDWDFKEKLAKFNFNSNSIYNYFGFEFRIPFWDAELIDFFKHLPLSARLNKYLYDDILTSTYFEKVGLNLPVELQPSEGELQKARVKKAIKNSLPPGIMDLMVRKKDNICYLEITSRLLNDLKKQGVKFRFYGNSYNSIIIQWYIRELQNLMKDK